MALLPLAERKNVQYKKDTHTEGERDADRQRKRHSVICKMAFVCSGLLLLLLLLL